MHKQPQCNNPNHPLNPHLPSSSNLPATKSAHYPYNMKLAAIIAISLSALALAAPAAPTKHSTEKQGKDPAQDFAKSLLGDVGKALKLLSP
ncbi:hypothetical protein BDV29DRAFT_171700 [Aspergillus leporis]|uniref:Uncharacterized protein n=1 Tax=Aspergillus leporis TaxID=41062 RepID=A0A5N5X667_9EURO|nr:hypothetical protein BDV29DRAFT_171700 [Aspergillus leporis]